MIFCVRRLHDFCVKRLCDIFCKWVFSEKKKFSGENSFLVNFF